MILGEIINLILFNRKFTRNLIYNIFFYIFGKIYEFLKNFNHKFLNFRQIFIKKIFGSTIL